MKCMPNPRGDDSEKTKIHSKIFAKGDDNKNAKTEFKKSSSLESKVQ